MTGPTADGVTEPAGQPEEPAEVTLPTSNCTVCSHPEAAAIDAGLLTGTAIRSVAETFRLSRASVGRHRQNHLSVQAITEPEPVEDRKPLRLVDVHGQLASLADRLEQVVGLATRTRKAPAAVAAMREMRQTLVAIAELQANPELQAAAALEVLQKQVEERGATAFVDLLDFVLAQFGHKFRHDSWGRTEQSSIVAQLMADCLRSLDKNGVETRFRDVDTSRAEAFVEKRALDRAAALEAEVRSRVEAELRRREAQARPAIEAHERRAIEGGAPAWGV